MCRLYHKNGYGWYVRHCARTGSRGHKSIQYLDQPARLMGTCSRGEKIRRQWEHIRSMTPEERTRPRAIRSVEWAGRSTPLEVG